MIITMFRRVSDKAAVDRDATRLIEESHRQAFARAGEMSWREDAGLIASQHPGHWHRVQQEIGRRQATLPTETPAIANIVARRSREHLAGLQ